MIKIIETTWESQPRRFARERSATNAHLREQIPELEALSSRNSGRPDVLVIRTDPSASDETIRELSRDFSAALGQLLPQDSEGALERDVVERPVTGRVARYSESRGEAPMHTDGMHMPDRTVPHYFTLGCIHAAREGGLLAFVHLDDVLNGILDEARDLSILQNEYWFSTKGVDPRGRDHVARPILEPSAEGGFEIQYAREYIDLGHALPGAPALDLNTIEVLDRLDAILATTDMRSYYKLKRGDVALIDNRRVLHSRTAFENASGDEPRRMIRLWIDGASASAGITRNTTEARD